MERGGENVTYSWKAVGQTVDEFHDSANLSISWRLGEKDKTIICTARNPVSSSSSTPLLTQKLCKGDSLLFPGDSGWRNAIFFSSQFLWKQAVSTKGLWEATRVGGKWKLDPVP